jgi:hypothetical protein
MSNLGVMETGTEETAQAAVRAWGRLRAGRVEPDTVTLLKRRTKSTIYRLAGVGLGGRAVIAKRCPAASALIERAIYQDLLPLLPFPALYCYGLVEDAAPQFLWIFLEDAGEELFSPARVEHCVTLAQWLALLHTSSACLPGAPRLPDRGCAYYLQQMRVARQNIAANAANPALDERDSAVLQELLLRLDSLDERWDQVESLCHGMPQTLVHGDLKAKNIRVRHTRRGIELVPFDWEMAGWGVPAVDLLKCPDLCPYWFEAQKHWRGLRLGALQRLARVGAVFRALIAIYWESLDLAGDWVHWPVIKLQFYHTRLEQSLAVLPIH